MPLQEVNFFAIVIAIQSQTGGNLAEALGNLSQVLRDRYRLQAKVKAFSAEAKASAMIIGSLPPCVMLLVYITTPDYIGILFHEKLGNIMLIASARVDADRHSRHAQDDQFRLLGVAHVLP